jgi:maleate isomerase
MAVHRIGLVVPSPNATVETELPALLRPHPFAGFSFHSTRMQMHTISAAELAAMNAQRERCVMEIADASPDVILYACPIAVMVGGPGEHARVEGGIAEQLAAGGSPALVRSSAGALVEALRTIDASRIAIVTPDMRPLAEQVIGYLESEGFKVSDWCALEVAGNAEVGCIPGERVLEAARSLDSPAWMPWSSPRACRCPRST